MSRVIYGMNEDFQGTFARRWKSIREELIESINEYYVIGKCAICFRKVMLISFYIYKFYYAHFFLLSC